MKLALETYVLRKHFGDFKALEMAKEAGFDGVDYSFYWTAPGQSMLDGDYVAYAKSLKAEMDRLGLSCNQCHSPFVLQNRDTWHLENDNYRDLVRSLEFAAILGAEHTVVHCLPGPNGKDLVEHNICFYNSLLPYCKEFGIKIAVENLFNAVTSTGIPVNRLATPELLNGVYNALDHDWFVTCIDVGHSLISGIQPEDFIRSVDPKTLRALHIQDGDGVKDRHMLPYLGSIHWDAVTAALAEVGYEADFTLEIFSFLDALDPALLPAALKLAAETGRLLIGKIEAAKA